MKKIGIVDIDTSHPGAWIPLERAMGFEVVGFYDSGAVHPAPAAANFAAEHGVRQFGELESLVAAVDIGIIQSCNWDTHLAKARCFVEAGKPVFIDKPMAGRWSDLQQLLAWERSGARITGGSCNLYAQEIQDYLARTSAEALTRAHTVLCGCGVDDFNYAIHGFSSAFAVLGFDWLKLRTARQGRLQVSHIVWRDGRQAVVTFGPHPWVQSHLTLVAEKSLEHLRLAIDDIYRPLLQATLPYLAGAKPARIPLASLVQPEIAMLASRRSLGQAERWVERGEMDQAPETYDGEAFAREYRRLRYPLPGTAH